MLLGGGFPLRQISLIPVRKEKIARIEFSKFLRLQLLDKIVHRDLSNITQTRQALDQDRLLQFCLREFMNSGIINHYNRPDRGVSRDFSVELFK